MVVPITSSCARRITDPRARRLDRYHYVSYPLEQVARYDHMYYVYYYYNYYGYDYYITTSVMDKTSVVIKQTDVNKKTDV